MRIVLLDDDTQRIDLIASTLNGNGYAFRPCSCVENAWKIFTYEGFELLVIGQTMADIQSVISLREKMPANFPVLLIAGHGEAERIVQLLESGIADYLVKPIRRNELLTRLEILLQRAYPDRNNKNHIQFGPYLFETQKSQLTKNGMEILLTQKEFELALLLFQHLGRPLSRVYIQDKIWVQEKEVPSRTIDTHISRVRTKLQLQPENGYRLLPVYSYGYQLEEVSS